MGINREREREREREKDMWEEGVEIYGERERERERISKERREDRCREEEIEIGENQCKYTWITPITWFISPW